MWRFLSRIRSWFGGSSKKSDSLTAVEYEAVSLIAYEGRAAYRRAREQAEYCRARGSDTGFRFWSEVSVEVAERTGMKIRPPTKQPRL